MYLERLVMNKVSLGMLQKVKSLFALQRKVTSCGGFLCPSMGYNGVNVSLIRHLSIRDYLILTKTKNHLHYIKTSTTISQCVTRYVYHEQRLQFGPHFWHYSYNDGQSSPAISKRKNVELYAHTLRHTYDTCIGCENN